MIKKSLLIAAGAALAAIAVSVFVYVNNGKNEMDDLFYANVEALARDEGTPVKTCYTQNWAGERGSYIFCNDKTSASIIYPCENETWGVKGIASMCVSR